jgi:LacI family repressor for deo operon, udp, cdd, tsx, nupC, and nupG
LTIDAHVCMKADGMPVSIKDIAREAGVSHSTVSRALSDSSLVSAETKSLIQQLAHEMGYSPDAQARSLVMGRTHTVGLVVTAITDPFIAEIVQAIERIALDHGYSVILASSNAEPEREIAAVEMLHSKRVDGLVVTSSRVGALYQDHLDRFGVPVVLVNSHSQQRGRYTFSVSVDNRHGALLATNHLVELGHRRIAYVTGPANHSDDLDRFAGYREALGQADIALDLSLVVPGTGRLDGGERALTVLLGLDDPPTAVFCYNDMTAIGLLRVARQAGASVPGDLAVIGFDDISFASYVQPRLTTIAQPTGLIGQRAMEMVLDLMADTGGGASSVFVQGKLIVRESSGAKLRPTGGIS